MGTVLFLIAPGAIACPSRSHRLKSNNCEYPSISPGKRRLACTDRITVHCTSWVHRNPEIIVSQGILEAVTLNNLMQC
jgi:hypothetical protein